MGRKIILDEPSPFYPPRARWYAGIFYLSDALRRRLALDRLALPAEMKIRHLLAGFLVPGLALYLRGPRLWGQAAMGAALFLLTVFIVWLGYPAANLAFGLMISIHATGLVYYCSPLLAHESLRGRLGFTLVILLALMFLVYWPMRSYALEHWVTPLRMQGRVYVMERTLPKHPIQPGDWVAYTMDQDSVGVNYHNGTVWLRGGLLLGPVLAVAGDELMFTNGFYTVNGVHHPSLPHMPVTGVLTVPEKYWFIWPNLDISGHGDVGEVRLSEALQGLAIVPERNYYGRPFNRWFGRKQILQ